MSGQNEVMEQRAEIGSVTKAFYNYKRPGGAAWKSADTVGMRLTVERRDTALAATLDRSPVIGRPGIAHDVIRDSRGLDSLRELVLPNVREVFPHGMSHRTQFHTVSSKGTCDSRVPSSSSTYVHSESE